MNAPAPDIPKTSPATLADKLAGIVAATGEPLPAVRLLHALEGVLRRVSALPAGQRETLVFRGSLLTRLWVRPARRPAADVDFVTTYDYDPGRATDVLRAAFTETNVDDGIAFDAGSLRVEPTWTHTPFPGRRALITCAVAGTTCAEPVRIDLGFNDPLVPPAEWLDYPAMLPGVTGDARVLAIRPELGCAWKVHGLFEFPGWRAKDLWDVDLIARHVPLDRPTLTEAVRVAFVSRRTPLSAADRLLEGRFGHSTGSRRRWRAFRRENAGDATIPEDHQEVVRRVAGFLRPTFEALVE